MAKELASKEGMMVGPSSGAAIKYALDLACRAEAKDKTIVVVVPSHGAAHQSSSPPPSRPTPDPRPTHAQPTPLRRAAHSVRDPA